MTKQEFIKRIIGMYEAGEPGLRFEKWQQRPYTAVNLTYRGHQAFGFSKVNWPDDWDEEEGVLLSLRKAAARIWKEFT
jgi:hypothetical protein